MSLSNQKNLLLLLAGPLGSGKSSTATALAARLRALGLSAAHIDLDIVYGMARQRDGFDDAAVWRAARRGAAAMADAFFQTGIQVVVVEGGFFTESDRADLADGLGSGAQVVSATLHVSFESALQRVQSDPDPGRVASRNPEFLRQLHDQYAAALPYLRQTTTLIEADKLPLQEVVRQITGLVTPFFWQFES